MNILIVFLVSGLWHGANWTFVVWGALHGFYLLTGAGTRAIRNSMIKWVGIRDDLTALRYVRLLCTFGLVCLAWIFFRAASLPDAWLILARLPTGWSRLLDPGHLSAQVGPVLLTWVCVGWCAAVLMDRLEAWRAKPGTIVTFESRPWWFRWASYYGLAAVLFFLHAVEPTQFIYFQF